MTETTTPDHAAAFDFGNQLGRSAPPAEFFQARRAPAVGPRAMPAGVGIVFAAILGLLLWLLIMLATASLVSAL